MDQAATHTSVLQYVQLSQWPVYVCKCKETVSCRLNAPWGTEDNPVEVTSSLAERIVGVPDPYDDSIIWWGSIEEGQPPKQIVETGEFFVLKRVAESDAHGGH